MYQRPADANAATWNKLEPPDDFSLMTTGVGYGKEINEGAKIMLITLIPYLVIQGITFTVDKMPKTDYSPAEKIEALESESRAENFWALVGLFVCIVQFIWYLKKQISDGAAVENTIAETTVLAMKEGKLTLRGALAAFKEKKLSLPAKGAIEQTLLDKETTDELRRTCKILAPFFGKYDLNGDGTIDFEEFRMIFRDVGENLTRQEEETIFKSADADGSGNICFVEFAACLMSFALDPSKYVSQHHEKAARTSVNTDKYLAPEASAAGNEEEGEEEDIPEDLADLDPQEQQRRIKNRAAWGMSLGTLLVLVFSDPMVGLLSELGKRIDVSAFYISFVLAPLASNASELVAGFNYAKKKTSKSITTSFSTLEGAAIMNNTFCLGIFLALVYFKNLAWEFSAETICILFVQVALAAQVVFRSVHRVLDGFVILSLYPVSLALVWVLENVFGMD
jgi:Ca2+/Na+ antiporter